MGENKKGSILVTALIVIALCSAVALLIHQRSVSSYAAVTGMQTEYQGAIYAMTAIEAVETAFKYDNPAYDGKEDIWNMLVPIPVEKGFLTVYIKPLNSKFPLNLLAEKEDDLRRRYEEGFEKLARSLNIEADLQSLRNWLGSGNPSSERIDENNAPYSFKGSPLKTMAELAYVPGYEDIFKDLSEYVSVGGDGNKININLAPEEVIVSYIPELEPYINDILASREDADFKDVSEIYKIMGQESQEEYNKILNYFDVKSSLFYVKLELNVLDENSYYHILFQRNGKNAKPVKYIEGGNIEYF